MTGVTLWPFDSPSPTGRQVRQPPAVEQHYARWFGNGRTAAGAGGPEVLLPQRVIGLHNGRPAGTVAVQDRRITAQVVPIDSVVGRIDHAIVVVVTVQTSGTLYR